MPVAAAVDVDSCLRSGVEKSKVGVDHAALIDFSKAIDADPKNAMAYQYRGVAKARFGDFKGSIIDYNKSIELNSMGYICHSSGTSWECPAYAPYCALAPIGSPKCSASALMPPKQ